MSCIPQIGVRIVIGSRKNSAFSSRNLRVSVDGDSGRLHNGQEQGIDLGAAVGIIVCMRIGAALCVSLPVTVGPSVAFAGGFKETGGSGLEDREMQGYGAVITQLGLEGLHVVAARSQDLAVPIVAFACRDRCLSCHGHPIPNDVGACARIGHIAGVLHTAFRHHHLNLVEEGVAGGVIVGEGGQRGGHRLDELQVVARRTTIELVAGELEAFVRSLDEVPAVANALVDGKMHRLVVRTHRGFASAGIGGGDLVAPSPHRRVGGNIFVSIGTTCRDYG